jgi:peptide/nickel transport system substrate-binding protein
MQRRFASLSAALVGLLVLAACAPAGVGPTRAPDVANTTAVEKTLTIAIQREPSSFDIQMTLDATGGRTGGRNQIPPIVNAALTWTDEQGNRKMGMATELPSAASQTWIVNADGTMDVTWKLRPDVYWHDGTPVTSEDFAFRFAAIKELGIVGTGGGREDLVRSVTPVDAQTLVAHWASVFIGGQDGVPIGGMAPLPKHILESTFAQDPSALSTHRYFTTEYVGTGPFRLLKWEQGSHLELERFERYFLGPAPITRIYLRFIPDSNTMVASIMAEAVDVLLPQGVDLDTAIEVRDRWQREGIGHQLQAFVLFQHIQLELMLDPTYARPASAWMEIPARQGLYTALDRAEIAQVMTAGLSPPADSHYNPTDVNYPMVKDHIPRFPYDPARARQLLAQAGWIAGSDGVLVHQPTGERFETLVYVTPSSDYQKLGALIQHYWKAIGATSTVEVIIPANVDNNQYLSTRSGPLAHNPSGNNMYESRLHSRRIPTAENRWTGNNRGHLNSPVVDDLIDRMASTIDPSEQATLHRQFVQETTGKVTSMPLYWETLPILMVKGVTGPKIFGGVATLEIHTWNKS